MAEPEFGLAPMEGISELPFRLWVSQTAAPPFMTTPFLRATSTYPRAIPADFAPELDAYRDLVNYRLIPQVMASDPTDFIRTARLWLETAAFVDLNAGCPSPNPISGGAGSGLLREAGCLTTFMRRAADALPAGRFSLKMRTGFDHTELFEQQLSGLKGLPLARLTVHGRTRRDRYDGNARWDLIDLAARTLSVPVVASGDIVSRESWAKRSHFADHIEAVIVGRGALRCPWIFHELRGSPMPSFPLELLELSLGCLGLLLEAHHAEAPALDSLIRSGCFRSSSGFDLEAWSELYARCSATLRGSFCPPRELSFARPIMGRLKMLWNSLRSSLPEPFFAPEILRASDFPAWVSAFHQLWDEGAPLRFRHRADLDWLYTSSRQRPAAASVLAAAQQSFAQL